ncbi:MAG: NAD(P)/FAD-dependent oxidoreductase, partial [Myxococcota bacterium]
MHYDVAIIGAGLSGLAAGIRCAHYNKRVVILEKHTVYGGLNSFYKKGGHHFDSGLHALTNWLRPGYKGPRLPLQRILRQLRISLDELELRPQNQSRVVFDDADLTFDNDFERLTASVEAAFPHERDGWQALAERCSGYPEAKGTGAPAESTRAVVSSLIRDPLLVEMILCPLFFYGSAEEDDLEFEQFRILYNSIFREGFCQPRRGIRQILDILVGRFAELGGQMRRNTAVESVVVEDGRVKGLEVSRGESVTADVVISSAGRFETDLLRSDLSGSVDTKAVGQLAFVEGLWVLDKDPAELGFKDSVVFYNQGPKFNWRKPEQTVDFSSGVICVPSNYQHDEPQPFLLRATHIANHEHWFGFEEPNYRSEKTKVAKTSMQTLSRYGSDFSDQVVYYDGFTPRTVKHYTSHLNGAVYGAP